MSFITDLGLYCYKVMSFGLKNTIATYQRLVNTMLTAQIERTMEIYVDDMLVKLNKDGDHVADLTKRFEILQKYGLKLNLLKCSFGVALGKFLGFIAKSRGIEANPKQISVLKDVQPSQMRK